MIKQCAGFTRDTALRPMRSIVMGAAAFLLSCCVTTSLARSQAESDQPKLHLSAVHALQDRLKALKTYQAHFTQTTTDSRGQVVQRSTGQVWLKRPSQFRWQTVTPTRQTMIANRTSLLIYDQDLAQVTRQKLTARTDNTAQLLTGNVQQLSAHYVVKSLPIESSGYVGYHLTPKVSTQASFVWLSLYFNGSQLVKMTMKNSLEQTSVFSFSRIHLNKPISPSWFIFHVPRGTDVIDG